MKTLATGTTLAASAFQALSLATALKNLTVKGESAAQLFFLQNGVDNAPVAPLSEACTEKKKQAFGIPVDLEPGQKAV